MYAIATTGMAKTVSDLTNHHSSVGSSCLISMIAMLLGVSDREYITLVTRKGNMGTSGIGLKS